MTDTINLPPPGLDGTYRDSCVGCFHGTDTALGFRGEAEWVIAGLMRFMPQSHAEALVSMSTGCDPGKVPAGEITLVFRVCKDCASKGEGEPFPVGLLVGDDPAIPVVTPLVTA